MKVERMNFKPRLTNDNTQRSAYLGWPSILIILSLYTSSDVKRTVKKISSVREHTKFCSFQKVAEHLLQGNIMLLLKNGLKHFT